MSFVKFHQEGWNYLIIRKKKILYLLYDMMFTQYKIGIDSSIMDNMDRSYEV